MFNCSTQGQHTGTLSTATVTDQDSSDVSNPLEDGSPSDSGGSATNNGEISSGSSGKYAIHKRIDQDMPQLYL